MRQFVGQQALAITRSGRVLTRPENHVPTYGIGPGVHRSGRFCCPGVTMHPYLAEIMAETGFHEAAGGRVQRLAGRAQHVVDNGGDGRSPPLTFLLTCRCIKGSGCSTSSSSSSSSSTCRCNAGAGMHITISAMRSASRSWRSPSWLMRNLACRGGGDMRFLRHSAHSPLGPRGRRRHIDVAGFRIGRGTDGGGLAGADFVATCACRLIVPVLDKSPWRSGLRSFQNWLQTRQ